MRIAAPLVATLVAISLFPALSFAQGKQGKQGKQAPAEQANTPPPEPTPRWPDGRVNLGSVPGKKGYWEVRPGLGGFGRGGDVPFQPWAKAVSDYRNATFTKDSPTVDCKPSPALASAPGFEIMDVPELKSIFILTIAGHHSWRVIYMDGRPHPQGEDLRPTFLGHSIGHWEGDTLVIDTVGFNEKQWAVGSFPTTSQLHLVERISRPNLTTLAYEETIDDPGAYTKSWSSRWTMSETTSSKWIPSGELFEYICQDADR